MTFQPKAGFYRAKSIANSYIKFSSSNWVFYTSFDFWFGSPASQTATLRWAYLTTSIRLRVTTVTKTTNDETWVTAKGYTTATLHEIYVKFTRWRLKHGTLRFFQRISIQEMSIVLQRILVLFYLVSTFFYSYGKRISVSTHLELWRSMA